MTRRVAHVGDPTVPGLGAATTLHPQVQGVSGKFFVDCNVAKPSSQATDAELAKKLGDFSMALVDTKAFTECKIVSCQT
ncbi:hypothetical protein Taro_031278 [Colocasia esculenta]|uniref:Uncharacterized protein n=1 Tax=Colocasia esculenta TaxID=4460 RepID=A0A843VU87_COLES|nr:hypothetical protein [Colocasia esculenta]